MSKNVLSSNHDFDAKMSNLISYATRHSSRRICLEIVAGDRTATKDFKQINSRFDHTNAVPTTIHVVHVGEENAFWNTNCKLLSPKCADSSVLEEGATARAGF